MKVQITDAVYRDEPLTEFRFNPVIEALPVSLEPGEAIRKLMIRPFYSESERFEPTSYRLSCTQRILRIHQPSEQEVDIYQRIDRCIRWGYTGRNPILPVYKELLNTGYEASVSDGSLNYINGYHPNTYGFSIIGISGTGKSTTVEGILSHYPQLIKHTSYRGYPLVMHQITWLKMDTPCDGSLKGLCSEFFRQIDALLGTSYNAQYTSRRATLNQLMTGMAQLCISYNIGAVVIDELQHLCSAKNDIPEKVLNYLVTLVNTLGVPVIMIGTPKTLAILQNEFQQAKRGSGQGDCFWEKLSNDSAWELFCKAIWPYQYTRKTVPFTKEMKDTLYEEAQGIPFLAVHIYKLVQEDAMLSEKETFSSADLHRIASKKMQLTKPMREAMKIGKEVDLKRYVDITPFSFSDYKDNYSIAAEAKKPASEPPKAYSVQESATITLMGLGLSHAEASRYVCTALAEDNSGCLESSVIARNAYHLYLNAPEPEETPVSPLSGLNGYEALKEAGVIANDPE